MSEIMKPEVIVFARPNGSGKSTITRMAKTVEASGISVGENPLIALTSELFLDSEPEAKTSHRVSGLPLTGSERNATMADRR